MRKGFIIAMSAAILMSSCGTYMGQGAYTGSTLGSILGSAIGGLSDGPRGHDVGTIVGMVGGAVVGAAIGNAADRRAEAEMIEHREAVKQRRAERDRYENDRRSEEHTSELQSRQYLVCRLLLEKKKKPIMNYVIS